MAVTVKKIRLAKCEGSLIATQLKQGVTDKKFRVWAIHYL